MDFNEVYSTYEELKAILINKKEAVVKKDLEQISKLDELTLIIIEKIKKFDIKNTPNSFSEDEKSQLRKLGEEISLIQERNKILINHSINVINNLLLGILHVSGSNSCAYTQKGKNKDTGNSIDISSITEEA